jgi:hypothetical protein
VVAATIFTSTPSHSSFVAVHRHSLLLLDLERQLLPLYFNQCSPRSYLSFQFQCASIRFSLAMGYQCKLCGLQLCELPFLGSRLLFRCNFSLHVYIVSDCRCDFGDTKEKFCAAFTFQRGLEKHIEVWPQGRIPHPSLGVRAFDCLFVFHNLVSSHSQLLALFLMNCVLQFLR